MESNGKFFKRRRVSLGRYIVKRVLWMIPVLVGVIVIVFSISYFTPGDPVMNILGSAGFTPEKYAAKQAELGLDKPFFTQLVNYIWNIFTKFNFGISFGSSIPVSMEIAHRLPITIRIELMSIALMIMIGLPVGMVSALKQYSILDTSLTALALVAAAIPGFVLAVLAMLLFSVNLRWLPISGISTWKAWILPVSCSALPGLAIFSRYTRTTMLEVIRQDYIRTARAKGLKESAVIRKHALINCMIPLTTVVGSFIATMFAGSIIIETIFAIPGMGLYLLGGITARDYPVINGVVFMVSVFVCVVNLIVDILYAVIDPRIRVQYASPKKLAKEREKLLQTEGGAL